LDLTKTNQHKDYRVQRISVSNHTNNLIHYHVVNVYSKFIFRIFDLMIFSSVMEEGDWDMRD